VHAAAKDVSRSLFLEAADAGELAANIAKHAVRSQSANGIESMIKMAQSQPGIPVLPREFDRHPFLFACRNGVIDLEAGKLREHSRDDMLTRIADVAYDPAAECPQWERFFKWAMADDAELARFVQKLLGRTLSGDVSEQFLPVFWGGGANGKSVVARVMGRVLGPYFHQAPPYLLLAGASERHLTELASLHGKRLVVCSETGEGRFFDETRVKELTGGELVTCRRMREDEWTYTPSAKLIVLTNHKPRVKGGDHAIWRRLRLVPFERVVAEKDRDPNLAEKLEHESSGILNWLLRGFALWRAEGMHEPTKVCTATQEYRSEQDAVSRFVDECGEKGPDKHVKASYLLTRYADWAKVRGEISLTQSELAQRLTQLGFTSERRKTGVHWLGFEVLPEDLFFSNG
jgi:putative DNA primase/helicase